MLKICTIRRQSDFRNIFTLGKSYPARYFILYAWPNTCDVNRFGFTAGKKIGNAVIRNRAKRLLKEVVRRHLREIKTGYDYILVARSAGVGKGLAEYDDDFIKLIRKHSLVQDTGREDHE
jgi:ribonuclease P protein component